MINKTLRRLAVGASAITVLGVVVPLAAATGASAAASPTLSVSPTSANTTVSSSVTYTVTPTPSNPTNGVSFDVYSGPDSPPGAPFTGTACTTADAGVTYSCVLNTGTNPGTDKIHFYEPATAGADYALGDPSTDGTAIVAGAVNSVTISPLGGSEAQGVYQAYTVTATDSAGRPVPGAAVSMTITQSNATNGDLGIGYNTTGLRNTNFIGTNAPSPAGTNGSRTANTTTSAGGGAQAVGTTTFNAASTVTGTLNISAYLTGAPGVSSNTTLTIDPGTANDVTSVVLTPSTANAFTTKNVTETVTLKNSQGDLVGGVTPAGFVTGANTAAATPSGATDGTGTATLSYTPALAGKDTMTGYVNQTNHAVNTAGLDTGEPSGQATITVAAEPAGTTLSDAYPGSIDTVSTSTGTTNVTFTLTKSGPAPLAGYTVNFSTPPSAKYSLGAASGTTNAQGQVTVAVTNNSPKAGDSVAVTATLQGDAAVTDTVTVAYNAPAANVVVIEPYAGVAAVGGSSPTYSATLYDQFGAPITSGVTYSWVVTGRNNTTNNLGATGTAQTFSYTDAGPTSSGGTDTVSVTATQTGVGSASDAVQQLFVLGTAKAAQANLDLGAANGTYVANGPGGTAPFVPNGFTKSATAAVSPDYTPANVQLEQVNVALVDANGNPLQGKSVTLSSTGVGQFFNYDPATGAYDIASGTSTTALVDPCDAANGDPCNATNYATVYVASNMTGKQTITATVDGITDTATVTYAGAYVPVSPVRLIDTRTGQGGIGVWNGVASPKGALAPNTLYYFDLSNTNAPLGAAAYVFNVTAIGAEGAGNLRVAPVTSCSGPVPTTSLINYESGKDVANSVVLPNTGGCGYTDEFVLYSAGSSANVTVDLQGYYPSANEFTGITPTRLADTRSSGGSIAAGSSRSFQVAGTNGIPVGASAVALNVTAIGPNGVGNLRVYPDGATVPTTSNVNYIPGVDKAAFVVVQLPANGKIDVYSAGSPVNVAIDVFGFYPTSVSLGGTSKTVTQAPVRVFDSRSGAELKAGVPVNVPVTQPGATNGVPAGAQAVLVSITAIHAADSTGVGNLRAYPAGTPTPTISNINYVSNDTDVANFAIVPVGSNGEISLYSAGSNINATVDILGYVPAGA